MENSTKINININRDDHNLNDYLFCWSELGQRPNKLSLFGYYDAVRFDDYVSKIRTGHFGLFTEVLPTGQDYVVNEKTLIKIQNNVFLSYSQFDKLTEETIIGEVSLIYLNESVEDINKILSDLENIEIDIEASNQRFNTLTLNQNGLELDSIELLKADYENIEHYFNDDVLKKANKLTKAIKKSNKGLSIIWGERGCGKTTLLNSISNNLDKMVIFIPCNMIETITGSPEFRNFLKRWKNSVLIIDDAELFFTQSFIKSNFLSTNLLQLIDGFQSDNFDINIILSLNVEDIKEIDSTLFDCNNLIDVIKVDYLTREKALELVKHLNGKQKINNSIRLIDVLKKRETIKEEEIGFK